MKPVTLVCAHCLKPQAMSRAAAHFWRDNEDIPYACPPCTRERIHQAVVACDIARFQAVTHAYQAITAP